MIKILFVCLGNICRSPTAEAVFRHQLNVAGFQDGYLENIFIDSAGTGDYNIGKAPDRRSRKVAAAHGISLEGLRARQITIQDFSDFDYILAMDQDNRRQMKALCPPAEQHKIRLFLDFAVPPLPAGGHIGGDVPDPYLGVASDFEKVYTIIQHGSAGFLDYILSSYAETLAKK